MARVLLGITGGIAAYKSCELVREYQRRGHEVRVIMTDAAEKFVTPLTFESLTKAPVYTNLFGDGAFGTAHIEIARWADLFVVAPATANTIARLAHGEANDFLSTVHLAYRGPFVLAPAMNTMMWEHPTLQSNLKTLKDRGALIVSPDEGELACGEIGVGKMAEPSRIAKESLSAIAKSLLAGLNVTVTAGPTREYIDPVRFLSSPSTGKMGIAIAREASRRGANVTVVHGPIPLPTNFRATFIPVTSAEEMAKEVERLTPSDIFIGAAAVADYRLAASKKEKIKRDGKSLILELSPTPDILAIAGKKRKEKSLFIGFSAETENLVPNAKKKLEAKQLDLIVANFVNRETIGFAQDQTSVTFVSRKDEEPFDRISKTDAAFALCDRIEILWKDKFENR